MPHAMQMRLQMLLLLACLSTALVVSARDKTVQGCQGQHLSLTCPTGSTIRILGAVYGPAPVGRCRRRKHRGPKRGQRRRNWDCRPHRVARELGRVCRDKEACRVHVRGARLSQHCQGVQGFLRARYFCVNNQQCSKARRDAKRLIEKAPKRGKRHTRQGASVLAKLGRIWLHHRHCFECPKRKRFHGFDGYHHDNDQRHELRHKRNQNRHGLNFKHRGKKHNRHSKKHHFRGFDEDDSSEYHHDNHQKHGLRHKRNQNRHGLNFKHRGKKHNRYSKKHHFRGLDEDDSSEYHHDNHQRHGLNFMHKGKKHHRLQKSGYSNRHSIEIEANTI